METVNNQAGTGIEKLVPSFRILLMIYMALFALSVWILGQYEARPDIYYFVVAAIAVVVLMEILFHQATDKITAVILVQVVLLMVSVIWSMSLKYYFFVGRTDVMGHVYDTQIVLDSGHITGDLGYYVAFAMWHILNSVLYQITGLQVPLQTVLFVASGMIFLAIPVTIYVLLMKLHDNRSMALTASLITSFSPIILQYGSYSIARSVIMFLFLVVIVLLLSRKGLSNQIMLVFFTQMIIMYHTVSSVFLIAILLLIYVLQFLFVKEREGRIVTARYLALFSGMVIAYWYFFAPKVLAVVVDNLLSAAPATGAVAKSVVQTPLSELANYLQYTPYIFFIIIGALLVLRSKHFDDRMKLFGTAALLLTVITFPGPAMLINKLMGNFQIDRFEMYTIVFMILVASVGMTILYQRTNKAIKILLIIGFGVWVLLSVSNDFVSSDNPLVKRPFYTNYLTENEVTSYNHIVGIHLDRIMSDYVTQRYYLFSPYADRATDPLNVNAKDHTFMQVKENNLLLLRAGELEKRPLKLCTAQEGIYDESAHKSDYDYYYRSNPVYSDLMRFDRVYDSDVIRAYL